MCSPTHRRLQPRTAGRLGSQNGDIGGAWRVDPPTSTQNLVGATTPATQRGRGACLGCDAVVVRRPPDRDRTATPRTQFNWVAPTPRTGYGAWRWRSVDDPGLVGRVRPHCRTSRVALIKRVRSAGSGRETARNRAKEMMLSPLARLEMKQSGQSAVSKRKRKIFRFYSINNSSRFKKHRHVSHSFTLLSFFSRRTSFVLVYPYNVSTVHKMSTCHLYA